MLASIWSKNIVTKRDNLENIRRALPYPVEPPPPHAPGTRSERDTWSNLVCLILHTE